MEPTPVHEGISERSMARVRDVTRVWEVVTAERQLAIYRAHKAGVPVEEIAHLALTTTGEVSAVIAEYLRDPEVDELPEGPDWIEVYRHHGWRSSM